MGYEAPMCVLCIGNCVFVCDISYKKKFAKEERYISRQRKKKDPSCGWGIVKVGPFLPFFFFFGPIL